MPEADLPEALSYTKGCYVGQEVVEKVASRGSLPRVIRAVSAPGRVELRPGDQVFSGDASQCLGTVLSAIQDEEFHRTIAFMRLRNEEGLHEVRVGDVLLTIFARLHP